MNTRIDSLYSYLLQQIAAESYFEGIYPSDKQAIELRLYLGTNREGFRSGDPALNEGYPGYTRMTRIQAQEFTSRFQVIHQWSDNPSTIGGIDVAPRPAPEGINGAPKLNSDILANTGLSATLIQKRDDSGSPLNEFTLAIRSTEFRNWEQGGDGERDKIGADILNVAVYGFALPQLDALEQYYQWLKDNGKLPLGAKLNVTGYSLGGHLATVFTEIHQGDRDIQFGETVTFNGAGRGAWNAANGSPKNLINFYHQILNNPQFASAPADTPLAQLRADAIARAGQPFDPKFIYGDARYQWAMVAAQQQFNLGTQPLSDGNRTGTFADGLITQVYGFETINNVNVTANSGFHGPTLAVGIESQPLIEGLTGGLGGIGGDFGNAHSITLIGDSLAVQRAMYKLDPTFTPGRFIEFLSAATNRSLTNGPDANYEVDALENLLDALRRMVLGPAITPTTGKEGASGFGDITTREQFHANLTALTDSENFKSLIGKVSVQTSGTGLADREKAHTDFEAFLALQTLSPFTLAPAAGSDTAGIWKSGPWAAAYKDWSTDKDLSQAKRDAGAATYSDRWFDDRQGLLHALVLRNQKNVEQNRLLRDPSIATDTVFSDIARELRIEVSRSVNPHGTNPLAFVSFGGSARDSFNGGSIDDRFYGGGGNDTLNGLKGNDYLEGNVGNDTLNGGDGRDTLVGGSGTDSLTGGEDDDLLLGGDGGDRYVVGGGVDTIRDSDGNGSVRFGNGGAILSGGTLTASGFYQSSDKSSAYAVSGSMSSTAGATLFVTGSTGRVRVEGFHNGDLGIRLSAGEPETIAPGLTADNDVFYFDSGAVADGLDGNDIITSNKADQELRGGGGNDLLFGDFGDDTLDGGAGNDFVNGGPGRDLLLGGSGNDLIIGVNYGTILENSETWKKLGASWRWDWDSGSPGARIFFDRRNGELAAQWTTNLGGTQFDATWATSTAARKDTFAPDIVLAGSGNDFVSGADGDDQISGDAGNDLLFGEFGDDNIYGGTGNDEIAAGDDADYVDGGAGADTVYGGYEADRLYGGADNDRLFGDLPELGTAESPDPLVKLARLGNDYLDGEEGDDTLWGGGGDDTLIGGSGADHLEGDGLDTPNAWVGKDTIDGGEGDDSLQGGGGKDTLYGGKGDDKLLGDGENGETESETDSDDRLDGGAGDDLIAGQGGDDIALGGEGDDGLMGGSGDDVLEGGAGDDQLQAGDGDDVLRGGAGADGLDGGDGNDRYVFETLDIGTNSGEVIDDTKGVNTVEIHGAVRLATYQIDDGSLRLELGDPGEHRTLILQDGFSKPDQALDIDSVSDGTVTVYDWMQAAVTESLTFIATKPDTLLFGGGGADRLTATLSGTTLRGGRGDDTLTFLNAAKGGSGAKFGLGDGQDKVVGTATALSITTRTENWASFDEGVDPASLQLVAETSAINGDPPRVFLRYGNGNDRIELGFAETGSAGVSRSFDRFYFADGSQLSWDQVAARGVRFVAPAQAASVVATPGNDTIDGTSGDDSIYGASGDDTIDGRGGNDVLDGGAGNDTILFGRGSGRDTVPATPPAGNDVIRFKAGVRREDVMWSRTGDSLLVRLRGSTDRMNVLSAFATKPKLRFVFADGTSYALSALKMTTGNQQASASADEIFLAPAGESVNALAGNDTVAGGAGNDTINGGDGEDSLSGGGGDDILDGGADFDVLDGGAGNDTYRFGRGSGEDRIVGMDTSETKTDSLLFGAGITVADVRIDRQSDDLRFTISGTNDSIFVGNFFGSPRPVDAVRFADGTSWSVAALKSMQLASTERDDTLIGFDSDDFIRGGAGNDSLSGAYGNDVLQGDEGNDRLSDDTGNDTLDGGAGQDWLAGGSGDDTYLIGLGDGLDDLVETPGGGQDRILLDAGINPENVTLYRVTGKRDNSDAAQLASVADSLVLRLADGTETWMPNYFANPGQGPVERIAFANGVVWQYADILAKVGSAAKGSMNAMTGSGANDSYTVDHPLDSITEAAGAGVDTVKSSVSYTLPTNVENLTLTGVLAIKGIGNAANNVLTGNAGDNVLDGGGGVDVMRGGAGNDVYRVFNATRNVQSIADMLQAPTSQVIEVANEGVDEMVTNFLTASLPDQVENLTVEGIARNYYDRMPDISGDLEFRYAGNALNNVIDLSRVPFSGEGQFPESLSTQSDHWIRMRTVLDGGLGADTMTGSFIDDTYVVDNAADRVIETGYFDGGFDVSSADRVVSNISYTLGAHIEELVLKGTAAINGTGNELANRLTGNAAANVLSGGEGNDSYSGGAGADTLLDRATASDDVYAWGRGDGADTLTDAGGTDRLDVGAGVNADQLWLRRLGNNLELSVIGSSDRFTVTDWYSGSATQVESLRLADGHVLQASRVQALVDAMAAFSPPAMGQTSLPAAYQTQLQAVIAANWQ